MTLLTKVVSINLEKISGTKSELIHVIPYQGDWYE